jgi:trans-aconitate methyltransferase
MAPERVEGFRTLLDQLPAEVTEFVDLGAGDGTVAEIVLGRYPSATGVLVDFSQPMITKGEQALGRFAGRFHYHEWDMNVGDWPAELSGPYGAVVSSAAIHHLDNDRKRWLAREVLKRLAPGGVFANYDLFRDPGATFGLDDVHDRTCASLAEAAEFLYVAGYADVLVTARSPRPARKGELTLMIGRRQTK